MNNGSEKIGGNRETIKIREKDSYMQYGREKLRIL